MTENAIMLMVIDGDIDKLGVLYERYKTPLYAYFFKLTGGNISSSQDLVQNVFYKVLKYKHSFKGTGEFVKWLFSIAHNIGIDYLRKESSRREVQLQEEYYKDSYELVSLEKVESRQLLYKALERLKDEERELLIMSKMRCLKYAEIAEIYNCSEVAIKTRVFRALGKLKNIYYKLENLSYEKK